MAVSTTRSSTLISLLVSTLLSALHGLWSRGTNNLQEWVSGETTSIAQWDYGTTDDIAYHKVWRQTQLEFDESDKPSGNGMAEWGNVYWATDNINGLTMQSGPDTNVRSAFVQNGKLDSSKDTGFRAISDNWPVFGFANDFGTVGSNSQSQLFTIGLLQQNAIQFLGADGLASLPSLWVDYFDNEIDAVSHVCAKCELWLIQNVGFILSPGLWNSGD
jgi:hypothetical protein